MRDSTAKVNPGIVTSSQDNYATPFCVYFDSKERYD
jgi:hypothetical protein